MSKTNAEVVIIGAGVIGCAVAYELSKHGARVVVVEKGDVGQEASWASAGVLSQPPPWRSPLANLQRESHRLFPTLVAELEELSGIDVEFTRCGGLHLAEDEADLETMRSFAGRFRQAGGQVELLTAEAARELEPSLWEGVPGGLLFAEDWQVRNPRFVRALAAAAEAKGVQFLRNTPALRIRAHQECVTGVETASDTITTAKVVIAAGAWSCQFSEAVGTPINVEPAKGEIVLTAHVPPLISHILHCGDCYLVPRRDGHLLIGSTVQFTGYDRSVTIGGLCQLVSAASALVPELKELPVLQTWAGLRPYAQRRGGPFLGPVPTLKGAFVAAGHYRSGIQLSAVTGKVLAEVVSGKEPSVPLHPFRVER